MDSCSLLEEDSANRFLCFNLGENRALSAVPRLQVLNPNVNVEADISPLKEKEEEYFVHFDLICVTGCCLKTLIWLNEICRKHNIKFFCGDVWGYYGYFFTDLQEHTYAIDVPKQKMDTIVVEETRGKRDGGTEEEETITEKRNISYCSLQDSLSFNWSKKPVKYFRRTPTTFFVIKALQTFRDLKEHDPRVNSINEDQKTLLELKQKVTQELELGVELINDHFISHCFSQLSPVCAIVGGVLAQEIIKAISAKDIPFHNMFLFDGVKSTGIVESLKP